MPKYTRYGYVTRQSIRLLGQITSCANIAFHLNPKLAHLNVDNMVDTFKSDKERFEAIQTIEDTTFTEFSGLWPQVMRQVLIKYHDGSTAEITIERWGVEVGKE